MEIQLDTGFQFGLGAFETIAIEEKKPIFLERHLRRLKRAADFLELGDLEERGITGKTVEAFLHEENADLRHGGLKIMLSEKNVLFQIRENHYTPEMYEQGFTMEFSKVRRNETSPLVYHKTMNYGDCILEKRAAAARGMQECIFLNTKGEIAEGAVSNIFFVKKGEVLTPKLSCGLLPGIIREYLLEQGEAKEAVITPDELECFEECFVTNSLMGIMPVRKLGGIEFTKKEKSDILREKMMADEEYRSSSLSYRLC